jgi:hypothetical protein
MTKMKMVMKGLMSDPQEELADTKLSDAFLDAHDGHLQSAKQSVLDSIRGVYPIRKTLNECDEFYKENE